MGKTSIYFPGDLSARAQALGINVSRVCTQALAEAIERVERDRCGRCGQSLPQAEAATSTRRTASQ